jgi:hypothetical protein
MLRRGIKINVSRSYDKNTQISNEETVQVTTSNVFTAILTKINNDVIVKEQQKILTNAYLLDVQKKDSNVTRIQDVPVPIPLAESADDKKAIKQNQKGKNVLEIQDSSNMPETPPEKRIELLLQEKKEIELQEKLKEAEYFRTTIWPTIRLLSCTKGRDYKKIIDNMIMQTNIFMNEFNLTNNDTIENNNDVSSKQTDINVKNNSKKSPNKSQKQIV